MAENVSSSVLFHFTNSIDNLKSILRNGFFPRYCPEYTLDPDDKKAVSKKRPPLSAAPMVCFCDLPLSLIRKHLVDYGEFGIGFDKKWGIKNGVTPVMYTHPKAQTRRPMSRLTSQAEKSNNNKAARDLALLAAYTKPFRGAAWRRNKFDRKVEFYNEREWRYVPVLKERPLFLCHEDYCNIAKLDDLHERFKREHALRISPDNIQYLILPDLTDESNILELARFVKKLYRPDDAVLVTTTIMTVNSIHEDI